MKGQRFRTGYNLSLTVDKSGTKIQDDVWKNMQKLDTLSFAPLGTHLFYGSCFLVLAYKAAGEIYIIKKAK